MFLLELPNEILDIIYYNSYKINNKKIKYNSYFKI